MNGIMTDVFKSIFRQQVTHSKRRGEKRLIKQLFRDGNGMLRSDAVTVVKKGEPE